MRITVMGGNRTNGVKGARVSVWAGCNNSVLVDRFVAPSYDPIGYCKKYPNGKHGLRYSAAVERAEEVDAAGSGLASAYAAAMQRARGLAIGMDLKTAVQVACDDASGMSWVWVLAVAMENGAEPDAVIGYLELGLRHSKSAALKELQKRATITGIYRGEHGPGWLQVAICAITLMYHTGTLVG